MRIKNGNSSNARRSGVTDESVYVNRREFLKKAGLAGAGVSLTSALPFMMGAWWSSDPSYQPHETVPSWPGDVLKRFPARRNQQFAPDRPLTESRLAFTYNNFYEFSSSKQDIWKQVKEFRARPWTLNVGGLVKNPREYDVDDLMRRMPIEERIYRFRCVEAWAMVVPWTGFPLRELIKEVQPRSDARFVRFTSFMRPDQAPGQSQGLFDSYPWPYTEGLRLDEANHELTLLAVGLYGQPLPKQNGAPVRLVVPWKYGFKNIKSITRIDFVESKPATFWNTLAPREYGFYANVDPEVPHPRWSQKTERLLGEDRKVPTMKYNGYGPQVADLYQGMDTDRIF